MILGILCTILAAGSLALIEKNKQLGREVSRLDANWQLERVRVRDLKNELDRVKRKYVRKRGANGRFTK